MQDNKKSPIITKRFRIDAQQRSALASSSRVKRIIACAGSGKTFVLTRSIIDILKKGACGPDEILAITFTKNATENMRQRIRDFLGEKIDYEALNIHTFNSFGNLIISENCYLLGLGSDYKLINISRSWQILYSIVKHAVFKNITVGKDTGRFLAEILKYIGDLKSNLISVNDLKSYHENSQQILSGFSSGALCRQEQEIARYQDDLLKIYGDYENIKNSNNLVDYHDHMFIPCKLLSENKKIREDYRKRYRYIFVDEFQDTDVAQGYLLSLLYGPSFNNLTVVGDDDQGIYSFRGACVENILDFHKWDCFLNPDGPGVLDCYLTTNYRSGSNIVRVIDSVICSNKNRFEKRLEPQSQKKHSEVFFSFFASRQEESENIAENIKILLSCGLRLKDIAVISRRKNFRHITGALDRNRIKYELISSRGFFYEPEILFILSWLMAIDDLENEQHLVYLLQSQKYRISDRDIFFLKNLVSTKSWEARVPGKNKTSLIDSLLLYKENRNISRICAARIRDFMEELNFYMRQSSVLNLSELINLIFEHSGMADELRSDFQKTSKQKIKNIETLIKIGSDFEMGQNDNYLESFILYLKDVARTEEEDPESISFSSGNSVKIMSIHAAKGLEFEAVFMPALKNSDYQGRITSRKFKVPSLLRKDRKIYKEIGNYSNKNSFEHELKEFNLEEERRIFYVGCSRAKKYLFLSVSEDENSAKPQNIEKQPDRTLLFLKDIIGSGKIISLGSGSHKYLEETFGPAEWSPAVSFERYVSGLHGSGGTAAGQPGPVFGGKEVFDDRKAVYFEKVLSGIVEAASVAPPGLDAGKISSIGGSEYLNKHLHKNLADGLGCAAGQAGFFFSEIKRLAKYPVSMYRAKDKHIKRNFSLTELLAYLSCPAYYRWRYVYNIPEPLNATAGIGQDVHRHIRALTMIKYENAVEDSFHFGDGISAASYLESLKNADDKEKIYGLVLNFYDSRIFNLRDISKILLEQLFYWNLKGFVITCKADRLDIMENNGLRIIDYKSSGSGCIRSGKRNISNKKHKGYMNQLKAYTCGISEIYGVKPHHISNCLFYLKDGYIFEKIFLPGELDSFKNLMLGAIRDINNRRFESGIKEGCKNSCSYFSLCSTGHTGQA